MSRHPLKTRPKNVYPIHWYHLSSTSSRFWRLSCVPSVVSFSGFKFRPGAKPVLSPICRLLFRTNWFISSLFHIFVVDRTFFPDQICQQNVILALVVVHWERDAHPTRSWGCIINCLKGLRSCNHCHAWFGWSASRVIPVADEVYRSSVCTNNAEASH